MTARPSASVVIACLLLSGCFSTTRIYSDPPGADVVLDAERRLGTTPVELEEMVWLWTRHQVTVQKEGYEPQVIRIRSEGLKFGYAAVCVCTAGLLLPMLLASTYPQQYTVTLQPTTPRAAATAYRSAPLVDFRE